MPAKLLIWNIQNFTLNKIDWTIGDIVHVYHPGTQTPKFSSAYNTLRNDYIIDNVTLADPDIFIIIEVISGRGVKGSLVSSKGASGVTTLLTRLRRVNQNWCLVPPLKLTDEIITAEIEEDDESDSTLQELLSEGGYTEAIGVFYRKDRMDFIGPYVWPNTPDNAAKTAVPPGDTVTPGAYPQEWQAGLPVNNYYAGQYEFKINDKEILFPGLKSRRPFFTKFREKTGNQRLISIASLHLPPQQSSAIQALVNLAEYFGNKYVTANNEVLLIAGDFNIDPYKDNVLSGFIVTEYGFKALLNKQTPPGSTMNYRSGNAKPTKWLKNSILDNILRKYGGNNAKDGDPQVTIIDRVTNQSLLYTPLNTILQQPTEQAQNELFRVPFNFKKIGPNPGTSDHLAMLLQI